MGSFLRPGPKLFLDFEENPKSVDELQIYIYKKGEYCVIFWKKVFMEDFR